MSESTQQPIGVTVRLETDFENALAHRALTAAPEVGLLLPCNVTVRQLPDGAIEVGLVDPMAMMGIVGNPALKPIAEEARARLERVRLELLKG